MNLASSGAGILAINRAGMWRQTSTTALSNHGGGVSRPLKCMEIFSENKFRSTNMEALSCDGYICGIWNILIRNSVVNREMKFVRIHGQTQLEVRRGVWPKTINAVGITQMVGVIQTSGRIPCCRLVNYRVISSVGNKLLIGISCFVILQPVMFTT